MRAMNNDNNNNVISQVAQVLEMHVPLNEKVSVRHVALTLNILLEADKKTDI
jgi:hypothetical protein